MGNKNQVFILHEGAERGEFRTVKVTATMVRGISDAEVHSILDILKNCRRRTVSSHPLSELDEIRIPYGSLRD